MRKDEVRHLVPASLRARRRRWQRAFTRAVDAWHWEFLKRQWLARLKLEPGFIHPTLEIQGRKDFQRFATISAGCWIEKDCTLWIAQEVGANPLLKLGNIYVGRNCYLGAFQPLEIGDDTIIGPYSYIITANHRYSDGHRTIRTQGYEGSPIIIGSDVWIGCHVTILPGARIGDRAVIGAGAVVTSSVPSGEVWGGVPARKITDANRSSAQP